MSPIRTSIRMWAAAPAMLAAASLVATPAYAAPLPPAPVAPAHADAAPSYDPADQTYENHRYRRYRHYRHHRYHRGPSVGDVLTGVLIIGGIAAIANSARRAEDRRYRDRDWRYPEPRRDDARWDAERGIDRAVSMCVDEVERDRRVETVDRADRTPGGWEISGTVADGEGFTCAIGQDGRIEDVDYGSRGSWRDEDEREDDGYARAPDDRQWDDDRYAAARARIDGQVPAPVSEEAQPAYPGGPVEGDEPVDGDLDIGTGYPGKAT